MGFECSNTPSLRVGSVEFQDFRPKVPVEPHAGGHGCLVTNPQGGLAYHMIPSDLASGKIPMDVLTLRKRLSSASTALVPGHKWPPPNPVAGHC